MTRPGTANVASYRLPDVITIGGQKCGTTSLYYYIRAHPEVSASRFKQTRYFAMGGNPGEEKEGNWHRGLEWCRSQWPERGRVIVEGFSLGYTDWPVEKGIPERIASVIPNARFLYMVRDPVERAISIWMGSLDGVGPTYLFGIN